MLFYSGFFNYKAFLASYEYLNPGDNGENVRYWLSDDDDEIPSEHYVSSPQLSGQRGRSKSLKPQEFFLTLRRLRRGFAETHLSHLFNVSQATVSRIVIS